MDDMNESLERSTEMDSYACENCFRRCVCVRDRDSGGAPRCLCGAELERASLAPGVYEIVDVASPTDSAKAPRVEHGPAEPEAERALPTRESKTLDQEEDIGY